METVSDFSKRVFNQIKDGELSNDNLEIQVAWYLNDVFKVVKNINETSLDDLDRTRRFISLERNFGIPKTHLILFINK